MNLGRYPLVTHLGAGDGILQTGLAVSLLDRYEEIAFPCYPQYENTFKSIFINHPRVSVYTVSRVQGEDWGSPRDYTYDASIASAGMVGRPHIRMGVYSGKGIGWDFSKSFYEHSGVPYHARWYRCPINEAAKLYPEQAKWPAGIGRKIFLHDDSTRGYHLYKRVARMNCFFPDRDFVGESMLRYADVINTAEEIHVIDSAFFWLVDSLNPIGRLYLHRYPRWPRPIEFKYESRFNWTCID